MTEPVGFPFKENYQEIDGVRLHYVDEGSGQESNLSDTVV